MTPNTELRATHGVASMKAWLKHSFLYKGYAKHRQRLEIRREARAWTPHDEHMLRFYSQFIKPGSLCFDVGANVGNRTKVFLRRGARVVAVEPQPLCVEHLRIGFGAHPDLTIEQQALGDHEGTAEMLIGSAHSLSSLSSSWITAVHSSGRFGTRTWQEKQQVRVTTLDALIDRYGTPDFVKIDVEGFEDHVVQGLSKQVPALSLEFIPEHLEPVFRSMAHLSTLGTFQTNYAIGESLDLVLAEWISADRMKSVLESLPRDNRVFGDIYVRF